MIATCAERATLFPREKRDLDLPGGPPVKRDQTVPGSRATLPNPLCSPSRVPVRHEGQERCAIS